MTHMKLTIGLFITTAITATSSMAKTDPGRLSYMTQMCHHSTAAVVKQALEIEGRSLDDFCGCISKSAVKQNDQPGDHAYALGYHEVNIIAQYTIRKSHTLLEMTAELTRRSDDYIRDYEISFETLETQMKMANKEFDVCYSAP